MGTHKEHLKSPGTQRERKHTAIGSSEPASQAANSCGYRTMVNVDAYPDEAEVPSFGPRMRCGKCGHLGASVPAGLDAATGHTEPTIRLPLDEARTNVVIAFVHLRIIILLPCARYATVRQ
jgi:hypothetical protein